MCFVPRMGFNFNALLTHFRPNGNAGTYEDVRLTESCQPGKKEYWTGTREQFIRLRKCGDRLNGWARFKIYY